MLRSVAVLLTGKVAMFEFGVVCEVFGLDRTDVGVPAFDFRVCGPEAGVALKSSTPGVEVTPEFDYSAFFDADLVAIPAGGTGRDFDPAAVSALVRAHRNGATVLTVCSGAFLAGAAGLLDGRACTTHWRYATRLAELYPDAHVDPDVLFVDEGDLVTSAGTAAGIDAALHIVRRAHGTDVANVIARRMVVPPQRDGGQRQYIEQPVLTCQSESLSELLDWLAENLDLTHTVDALAARVAMSPRTFARKFAAETGTTPVRWLTNQRVLAAQRLLEHSGSDLEMIAEQVGFGSAQLLRHHFQRAVGVAPTQYRRRFGRLA